MYTKVDCNIFIEFSLHDNPRKYLTLILAGNNILTTILYHSAFDDLSVDSQNFNKPRMLCDLRELYVNS